MTVEQLKKELNAFPTDWEVTVGSDEELNQIFTGVEVADITEAGEGKPHRMVIYGLSGTTLDEMD